MEQKIRLTIAGNDYVIATDESKEYMTALAGEVDENIRKAAGRSGHMNTASAAVLVALDYCDQLHKMGGADMTESTFMDANARAQFELTRAYREIEKLNNENRKLRRQSEI